MAKFAKYEYLMEAFNEHAKLLSKGGAYKKARENENDPMAFADALTGTYATDPNYGEKLKRIMAEQSGAMAIGKMQLAATQTPLNSMSSQAIANNAINSRGDTNIKIDVGGVHTQATNGREVANQLTDTWQSQINSATNFFDDGRMA